MNSKWRCLLTPNRTVSHVATGAARERQQKFMLFSFIKQARKGVSVIMQLGYREVVFLSRRVPVEQSQDRS